MDGKPIRKFGLKFNAASKLAEQRTYYFFLYPSQNSRNSSSSFEICGGGSGEMPPKENGANQRGAE
jgi:hypothetical protein